MNYIIEKETNKVIWINSEPVQLSGESVWSGFNPEFHVSIFSERYHVEVGEIFRAQIENGIALEFVPKSVFNKQTCEERILSGWDDEIDTESETEQRPIEDNSGKYLPNQIFKNGEWSLDPEKKRQIYLRYLEIMFLQKCEWGIEFEGHRFQSNEESLRRLTSAYTDWTLGTVTPYWIRSNNDHHPIDNLEHFILLIKAIGGHWRRLFGIRTAIRDEINSLDSAQLFEFDLETKWSEVEAQIPS